MSEVTEILSPLPAVTLLSPQQLSKLLDTAKLLEDWIKAARAAAEALLNEDPDSVPGYELGPTKGVRNWVGETTAETLLVSGGLTRVSIYDTKIISPAKAEDMLARHLKDTDKATYKTLKAAKAAAKEMLRHNIHAISSGIALRRKEEPSMSEDGSDFDTDV